MEIAKSQSEYLNITQTLLMDISSANKTVHWFTPSDARLTFKKVAKRYEKEGLSFLTKTLPRYRKALDKALSGQHAFVIQGWQKLPLSNLPKFLGEFTTRVFERDGWLKTSPCTDSIVVLRLITGLFYKLELTYEREQEKSVLDAFKASEADLNCSADTLPSGASGITCAEECDPEPTTVSDLAASSCVTEQRAGTVEVPTPVADSAFERSKSCCFGSASVVPGDVPDDHKQHNWLWVRLRDDSGEPVGQRISVGERLDSSGEHAIERAIADRSGRASKEPGRSGASLGKDADSTFDAGCQSEIEDSSESVCSAGSNAYWDDTNELSLNGCKIPLSRKDLVDGMRRLLKRLFRGFDPYNITPSHGPGAVSHGEKPWEKRHFKRYYKRLDAVYPYDQYMYWSPSHLCDELGTLQALVDEDPIARVCLVNKDSRGPRVISCEPLELMWIQQGLMRSLYKHTKEHPLTKGCLEFTDQDINNHLAREGSVGGLATIDLKEASDRVALSLVRRVFPEPLVSALIAVRSVATRLPSGETLPLQKYAPMGSSLCFPVMACVIWSSITVALMQKYSYSDPNRFVGRVFVYGDDVIVPEQDAADAIMALEAVGLKVNIDKSYTTGQFKESCGGFYFRGHDVSGITIRTPYSSSWSPETYASWIDYSNQFYRRGYPLVAGYIADRLRSIYGPIPISSDQGAQAPCPALIHWEGDTATEMSVSRRWDPNLQRFEVRALVLSPRKERRREVGWCDLLASASSLGKESWPPIRTVVKNNIFTRYLEVGCSGAPVGGPKPNDTRTQELNPGIPWRWYTVRRRSKLQRRWVSGEGLT